MWGDPSKIQYFDFLEKMSAMKFFILKTSSDKNEQNSILSRTVKKFLKSVKGLGQKSNFCETL